MPPVAAPLLNASHTSTTHQMPLFFDQTALTKGQLAGTSGRLGDGHLGLWGSFRCAPQEHGGKLLLFLLLLSCSKPLNLPLFSARQGSLPKKPLLYKETCASCTLAKFLSTVKGGLAGLYERPTIHAAWMGCRCCTRPLKYGLAITAADGEPRNRC